MRRNRLAMVKGEPSCAAAVRVSGHKVSVGTDGGRWVVEDWKLEDGQSWQCWEVLRGEGKRSRRQMHVDAVDELTPDKHASIHAAHASSDKNRCGSEVRTVSPRRVQRAAAQRQVTTLAPVGRPQPFRVQGPPKKSWTTN